MSLISFIITGSHRPVFLQVSLTALLSVIVGPKSMARLLLEAKARSESPACPLESFVFVFKILFLCS